MMGAGWFAVIVLAVMGHAPEAVFLGIACATMAAVTKL